MRPIYYLINLLLIFSVVAVCLFFYIFYLDKQTFKTTKIEIERNTGLRTISDLLEENSVIKNGDFFTVFAVLNRTHNKLKAGEYEFASGGSINQIHKLLLKGSNVFQSVTIPEGYTLKQIAAVLEENKVISTNDFYTLATNKEYIKEKVGIEADSLEGFLFPDTYLFKKNEPAKVVLDTMIEKFFKTFNTIENNNELDLNLLEIVTYASIVERETGMDSERDKVSAVIRNRLKKGMKLQCDPTVIYALGDKFDGNLTKKDLSYKSPYNTYYIVGLPKGPIANPGRESLIASLNPADVDYLYFVSKGDGSHHFSNDYRSHINMVNKYILKKK